MPVPMEEAKRFGIVITDDNRQITDFEEKPEHPRSNLASMGIYIFTWKVLKEALIALADQSSLDFGKHIIPYCHEKKQRLFAYEYNSYWKDVGTLNSYWEANMELIDIIPEFNLYEEYWRIFTKSEIVTPQFIGADSEIEKSIIGEGSQIDGKVYNSVLGCGVRVGKDTVIRDSIIMNGTVIGENCEIEKGIIAEDAVIGDRVKIGYGEEVDNATNPDIYNHGITTIAERSEIPSGLTIGKNSVMSGVFTIDEFKDETVPSGKTIIKEGGR